MERHFDQELAELKDRLLTMASHAESAVTRSVKALVERDDELARQVKADDDVIDRFEIELDELAISLLAKAPLASDLRLVAAAMKISHDLERVGDEATKMARRALDLNQEPPLKPRVDLPLLATRSLEMLRAALDAFVNGDTDRARDVIGRDQEVDALNKQIHRELADGMIGKPDTIARSLNLMVISKSLERIADHATNIAEEVVYLYEGRDIRHVGKAQPNTEAQNP
ncbi:MAG: phosphate signaling complex protein PhoU [Limisphaerales bacterium]